jgi:hypothetical protein
MAVILAAYLAIPAAKAQTDTTNAKSIGILAGLKLNDSRLMATVGTAITHSNGFQSTATIDLRPGLQAIQYNASLRIAQVHKWALSAVLGPNVEAVGGTLTDADKITYLMAATGASLSYQIAGGPSVAISAWYLLPSADIAPLKIAITAHFPL